MKFAIYWINNKCTPSSRGLCYIMQKEYIPNIPEYLSMIVNHMYVMFDHKARFDLCVMSSS